jgi:translation initiation factor 5B
MLCTALTIGEGIHDLLLLLVQWTQKTMEEKLTFVDEVQVMYFDLYYTITEKCILIDCLVVFQCTVLEVKVVEGHGTTIDVVLVNGILHEGDQIVVCGMQVDVILIYI